VGSGNPAPSAKNIILGIRFPSWEYGSSEGHQQEANREFAQGNPKPADEPLRRWANIVKESFWANPGELKAGFGAADFVGDLTVFNIGGNKYRLIAFVDYRRQIVYIKHILTHRQYDKGDWKQ
jgi:mRNA interferase HigB